MVKRRESWPAYRVFSLLKFLIILFSVAIIDGMFCSDGDMTLSMS